MKRGSQSLKLNNPVYHFMETETNESTVEVEENLSDLPEDTDWKAKAEELNKKRTEDGIKQRERTKILKEEHLAKVEELNKPKQPESKKTKEEKTTDDFGLLEQTYLNSEGIKEDDEVEFVKEQLKKARYTKEELPLLFKNEYFQAELEKLRTTKSNQVATSDVKGDGGAASKVKDADYYASLNDPSKLPEKKRGNVKIRAEIARKLVKNSENKKMFYNE